MSEVSALTLDELRARMATVDLPIATERLEMVRKLLADALTPVRRMDARRLATLEPAVRFDADPVDGTAAAGPERAAPPFTARPASATAIQHGAEDELCYLGIRELGARFRRRQLSPVELTTALLDRIERLDPVLHAFVTLDRRPRARRRQGGRGRAAQAATPSPLLGIPIAYKDLYATRGDPHDRRLGPAGRLGPRRRTRRASRGCRRPAA